MRNYHTYWEKSFNRAVKDYKNELLGDYDIVYRAEKGKRENIVIIRVKL